MESVCVEQSMPASIMFSTPPATGSVTMIDFEVMQAVDGTVTEEVPELQAIFGRDVIAER